MTWEAFDNPNSKLQTLSLEQVWEAVEAVLGGMNKLLLDDASLSGKFKAFASLLIAGAAQRVGWEPMADDGHLGGLQRACMVRLQGKFSAPAEAQRQVRYMLYVMMRILSPLSYTAVHTACKCKCKCKRTTAVFSIPRCGVMCAPNTTTNTRCCFVMTQ